MAPPNRQPPIRSPLLGAMNNIVNVKRSSYQLRSTRNSLDDFMRFMNTEVASLKAQQLPDEKKISKLSSLNMPATFGRSGSLLSALASGAMDVAGFLGDFFRGKKKPNPKGGKPIPKAKGIRLGGLRAVGIVNAAFAGLDFATGLAEGESVGKAAAGAGGALAGSLLGGAIGQALIPVPGLGFMIGSMAGNFLGGYTGDRVHEAVTGTGGAKEDVEQRLAQNEAKQRATAASSVVGGTTFSSVLDQFDEVIYLFERNMLQMANAASSATSGEDGEQVQEYGPPMDELEGGKPTGNPLQDVMAEGGRKPSTSIITSGFGWRWGREHLGTDYGENEGTPISVIQPGTVKFAGWNGGGGNVVHMDHPDGSHTRYLHLSKPANVSTGQQVEPGTVIGYVGSTGRSTGPHLHFEYAPPGAGNVDSAPYADNYFRFGGNVKVRPKEGPSGQPGSGAPTVVLAAGTNNFYDKDPAQAKAALERSIKDLQSKGYNVVYIPPNNQGEFANMSAALTETATAAGATIERAQYGTGDRQSRAHFAAGEADRIKTKYQGATFMGDSNAAALGGEKAGMRVTSERMENIAGFTQNLPTVTRAQPAAAPAPTAPSLTPPVKPDRSKFIGRSGAKAYKKAMEKYEIAMKEYNEQKSKSVAAVPATPVAPSQVSRYPEYNLPTQSPPSTLVIMPGTSGGSGRSPSPMMASGGNGGGGDIAPSISKNQLLNSLFTTALLTNLSGT